MRQYLNFTVNPHVRAVQEQLGFTGRDLDGKRGNDTLTALLRAVDEGRVTVAAPLVIIKKPELDTSTALAADADLRGVHPVLVKIILEAGKRCPVPFDVIEGVRTSARQAQLVKQGASKTHDSRHLTGHAADLWPKDPATGRNLPSDAAFPRGSAEARAADARLWKDLRVIATYMKQVAKEMGVPLEWGGDWGWDAPHFQLNRTAYPK